MNFDFCLSDIDNLLDHIDEIDRMRRSDTDSYITKRYEDIIKDIPFAWFFCKGLFYGDIPDDVKSGGTLFKNTAITTNLLTLKGRLASCEKYSTIHIGVVFSDLKKQIIDLINKASGSIKIAVAWLSNKEIIAAIERAIERGVDTALIVYDDKPNRDALVKLSNVVFAKAFGERGSNIMHNKFCVFDAETVITGSYNWSQNADNNEENIAIIADTGTADKFDKKFRELLVKFKK